jgi:hypothetical protein
MRTCCLVTVRGIYTPVLTPRSPADHCQLQSFLPDKLFVPAFRISGRARDLCRSVYSPDDIRRELSLSIWIQLVQREGTPINMRLSARKYFLYRSI